MLESPEARAKLRRKLENWPDGHKSPVTINQGLELLDIAENLETDNRRVRKDFSAAASHARRVEKDRELLQAAMRGLIHEISRIRENPASPCAGAFPFCPHESLGECDDNMNCPECWEHYAMEEAKKRLGIENGKD